MVIINFFKERKERREKLADLKDQWLHYQPHYFLFNIKHNDVMNNNQPTIFKFHYEFTREMQQKSQDEYSIMAVKKTRELLSPNMGYWLGKKKTGCIIQNPVDVDCRELTLAEWKEIDKPE